LVEGGAGAAEAEVAGEEAVGVVAAVPDAAFFGDGGEEELLQRGAVVVDNLGNLRGDWQQDLNF